MELVDPVVTQVETLGVEEIIINKRTLEILVVTKVAEEILEVVQVVAVELTLVVEQILQVELDKALVDLEMVMAQDRKSTRLNSSH